MSIPGAANPLLLATAAAGGYSISRSLRFADSAYLSRTFTSAGNRKTWSWAGWVKRSAIAANQYFFGCNVVQTNGQSLYFSFAEGAFNVLSFGFFWRTTTALFRDPSAWYHVVVAVDTTQVTANNRIRVYINGIEQTSFSTLNNPSQNADLGINQAGAHVIGDYAVGGNLFFNGYLADIHFIDGQALDPTSFGEFDTNGIFQPKRYAGTYGTNGFKLDFADNSSNTATTLGKDTSGNGNHWLPNNLSVTAGAGNDSLVDSPTNYGTDTGVGGQVRGNYATWNPLSNVGHTLSNGNLDASSTAISTTIGTIGMASGKYYWEITLNTVSANVSPTFGYVNELFRVAATTSTYYIGSGANDGVIRRDNGQYFQNNTSTSMTGSSGFSAGDVAILAFDADAKKMWVGKNGTWYNNGNPAAGTGNVPFTITGRVFFPAINTFGDSWTTNFGQRPFAYTAPSGFKALCTANLPAPTITKPSSVFDVVTYTGTGSTLTPTSSLGFNPDLVWIKSRSAATDHTLYDSVRGAQARLASNTTGAQVTSDNGLTAFNSNGFTLGTLAQVNTNAATYAGWTWDAGSSTVTNTAGSITSSVRANASAGFSIVTYTGTGVTGTVGHGLGVSPSLVIIKKRSSSTNSNWIVWSKMVYDAYGANSYQVLDVTNGYFTFSGVFGSNVSSTTFPVGTNSAVNGSSDTYVAYCFAPVNSYSAFGSYTGNGNTDGPFVFCNFRPRWILFKRTDTTSNWTIIDAAREGYNVDNDPLFPNLVDAEGTADLADILSNGFKLRSTDASVNANAGTYVYACFAESPFSLARAR